ncbi:hypothetical protein JMUB5056_1010 [Leptotrichia hongkongensis]|uniref:Uncharacterized protein n=1 Tax=Leptotrichia hongkongensis TaxID=554406 RepID=A0A510L6J1_9FUSO|nr:hypothetical protein [Leptotrichia hongkongensis]BBM59426.1 hypothetical protein JMUB5056_1010 [Leptotrichia hongkongensis]
MKMRKLIYWILALMSITLKQLDAYNYEVAIKIICGFIDLIVVLRILSYLMSIDCFEKEYLIIKKVVIIETTTNYRKLF